MEPEVHKYRLFAPTYLDPDESSCKNKQFFFKIFFIIILPHEWFIFQFYQIKLCMYLLSGETLYYKKCIVAGKI
jgi:hypothetical protein